MCPKHIGLKGIVFWHIEVAYEGRHLSAIYAHRMVRTNGVVEDKPICKFAVELIEVIQQGVRMPYGEVLKAFFR